MVATQEDSVALPTGTEHAHNKLISFKKKSEIIEALLCCSCIKDNPSRVCGGPKTAVPWHNP